jgi:hypothetical protein
MGCNRLFSVPPASPNLLKLNTILHSNPWGAAKIFSMSYATLRRTPRLLSSVTSIWTKSLVRRFRGQKENPCCNAGLEAESPRASSFSADSLLGVTPITSNGAAGHSQMFSRFGIVLDKHVSLQRYCHLLFCPKPGASPPVSL